MHIIDWIILMCYFLLLIVLFEIENNETKVIKTIKKWKNCL